MSHISSKGLYYTVFLALIALTVITVVVARVDLGAFNTPIALGVAA